MLAEHLGKLAGVLIPYLSSDFSHIQSGLSQKSAAVWHPVGLQIRIDGGSINLLKHFFMEVSGKEKVCERVCRVIRPVQMIYQVLPDRFDLFSLGPIHVQAVFSLRCDLWGARKRNNSITLSLK